MPLNWKFSSQELEKIESHRLRKSSMYTLIKKIRRTGLFRFVEPRMHEDDEMGLEWFVSVAEHGSSSLHAIWNMYHFKALCLHNGVNLKDLLAKGESLELDLSPESRRGFKTVGQAPRPRIKKFEEMI